MIGPTIRALPGICGTFMAGIAQLASGHAVRGYDSGVYPSMSTLLHSQDIEIAEGYLPEHFGTNTRPDTVLIGNALSRGNPLVEHVLNKKWTFCSDPE